MSDEALLSMDEGTLRKLLEATVDLAERRQIRSAIRELRRQELERDEEALASKRFRTERQENKENRLRSWQQEEEQRQQKSLDALSRKLETIQNVEELTSLVQNRAGEELVPSQIQEPLDPKAADDPAESSSGTVLLLEAVPSHRPSQSAPFPDKEASGEDPGPNSRDQDSSPEPQPPSSEEEEEEEEEAGGLAPPKVQEGLNSSEGEASSQTREEEQLEMGSSFGGRLGVLSWQPLNGKEGGAGLSPRGDLGREHGPPPSGP
ncbi:hypothetical protein L345_10694, partial [Ophiophagus hannah]